MSSSDWLKRDLEQAQADLSRASRRLAAAQEERNASHEAPTAEQHKVDVFSVPEGSNPHYQQAMKNARRRYEAAKAAFLTSEQKVRDAKAEVSAAQIKIDTFERALSEEEAWERGASGRFRGDHANESNLRGQYRKRSEEWDKSQGWNQKKEKRPRAADASPAPPLKKQSANRSTSEQIQDWHQACAEAFKDMAQMRVFPEPPCEPCSDLGCNIAKCFEGRSTLKTDRLLFHPDRFSSVPEDVRETIRRAANEMFVVVNGMYQ
ncbi:hypothetical protein B0A55_10976 [Friedmanniomyces simplex]|uniref:Uncharacterized protein n=1 Tax=Friedmanniomyces simplex TaxID=329884 RepID=A0A4U0WQH6_9PEZI|nr:hypothetical protein B0A55_10976 [Friedmanniomyces simplex]